MGWKKFAAVLAAAILIPFHLRHPDQNRVNPPNDPATKKVGTAVVDTAQTRMNIEKSLLERKNRADSTLNANVKKNEDLRKKEQLY
ncbi:MAG: hypothetical protein ABIG96_00470 [Candidatus Micrarchaeota archaeon]